MEEGIVYPGSTPAAIPRNVCNLLINMWLTAMRGKLGEMHILKIRINVRNLVLLRSGFDSQEAVFGQQVRGITNRAKRESRTLCDVEQRMLSVGQIQYPKACRDLLTYSLSARGSVEVPASQLRLAIGVLIAVAAVVLEEVHYGHTNP
jgi:hypothetical protein